MKASKIIGSVFPLNIMLRVSFFPGRGRACRHCWISSFLPPGKTATVFTKETLQTVPGKHFKTKNYDRISENISKKSKFEICSWWWWWCFNGLCLTAQSFETAPKLICLNVLTNDKNKNIFWYCWHILIAAKPNTQCSKHNCCCSAIHSPKFVFSFPNPYFSKARH